MGRVIRRNVQIMEHGEGDGFYWVQSIVFIIKLGIDVIISGCCVENEVDD